MRNITIKDIAKKSGVSTATVSRVLNNSGYASKEVRKKVHSVIQELNYRPNAIARSLKMSKTNTIGVIIPDISNPYFMRISKGIEDIIEKNEYILMIASSDENPKKEEKILQAFIENRVDAIVLATSKGDIEPPHTMQNSNLPLVLMDRKIENKSGKYNYVIEDNFKGAYELTKHLIQKGHKRIGVINGLLRVSTGRDRYLGFKQALNEYGITENPNYIYNGNFNIQDGKEAVSFFFKNTEKPTAILSLNNMMTLGAMVELQKMGVMVPRDLTIASYGETELESFFNSPGVISIRQFPYEMGVEIGNLVLDQLVNQKKKPIQKVINPVLNV